MNTKFRKIVITGPESTGKSTLTKLLANHYNTLCIEEYAREYVSKLGRPYNFSDLEHIAHKQVTEIESIRLENDTYLFIDTHLIITKVWFDVVYRSCPEWIINQIKKSDIDLYLLCKTDLPWIADGIRENGGVKREQLYSVYKNELENFNLNYRIVEGVGNERFKNAITQIKSFFKE